MTSHPRLALHLLRLVPELLDALGRRLGEEHQHARKAEFGQAPHCRSVTRPQGGELDRSRIASSFVGCLMHDSEQPGQLVGISNKRKIPITRASRPAGRGLTVTTNKNRHRTAHGLGNTVNGFKAIELPMERGGAVTPERSDSVNRFVTTPASRAEGLTHRGVLVATPT